MVVALLRRFPRPVYRPKKPWPWLPNADHPDYTVLAADLRAVHEKLMPTFTAADEAALRAQNSFRRAQVTLILGGAVIAILGSLQAALGDDVTWPSVIQLTVGAGLTIVAGMHTKLGSQQAYLKERLAAERLRGEAFLFLGRIGYPADLSEASARLEDRVKEIHAEATDG